MRHAVTGVMAVTGHENGRIDMSARYALSADVQPFMRGPGVVQIGTEDPRRVLLRNAPQEATRVLGALDGGAPVGNVLMAHDADPLLWRSLLDELLTAGLLVPAPPRGPGTGSAHLAQERIALIHRHGHAAAVRILQARRDALVVVRGSSAAASLIATLVAAAGVGHVHHDATRTGSESPAGTRHGAGPSAAEALRAANPFVRTHPPAGHQSPAVVVLAGDHVPDLAVAATLVRQRIPHLPVLTEAGRAMVGPLVLPGRSTCLGCVDRHRTDADPGWPTVSRHLSGQAPRAPVAMSAIAAGYAAFQVLELVDGAAAPTTVNGSVEWRTDTLSARRRTWSGHPDCGCRAFA